MLISFVEFLSKMITMYYTGLKGKSKDSAKVRLCVSDLKWYGFAVLLLPNLNELCGITNDQQLLFVDLLRTED
jgi:hypothetical protein